jgi:hypothetical protein
MTPHPPSPIPASLKWRGALSAFVLAIGLLLLTYMVRVEGEPGAIPLLLVLLGGIGAIVTWRRARAHRR